MGPGPDRVAAGPADADARPSPLSPYARSLIRHKAVRLCRHPGFTPSDRDDVAQDLALAVLAKAPLYDPARGASPDTFADRVVDSAAKMILRARRRQKRAAGYAAASLDRDATVVGRRPVPLAEATAAGDDRRLGRAEPGVGEPLPDARAAAAVLATLPPFPAAVAGRLGDASVLAISRELGVSRRQVYAAIGVVRDRFVAAGLGPE
jgi:DNA-directed RNA polymerase specialized sigma24 family protein